MKKLLFIILLSIAFLNASAQEGSYVLKLVSASIDGNSTGNIAIDSIKPAKLIMYLSNYRDSTINASFKWSLSSISFELINKTKSLIKIMWNDAAYIDYSGNTGKVMHSGVKFVDRNNDQPSTPIISEAKISDLLTPTNNVYYSSGYSGGWEKRPLLPNIGKNDEKSLVGKNVKVLLPILVNSKQLNYVFSFEILFKEYTKKSN